MDEKVLEAVDALPDEFREALVLSDVEGHELRRNRRNPGASAGHREVAAFRARRLLQERLYAYAVEMGYIKPGSPAMGDRIDCRQATEQLHDYSSGKSPGLAEEIRAHLDRCKPCFNHAQFEENFLRLLESCGRQRCPGTLRARIVALLQTEAERD